MGISLLKLSDIIKLMRPHQYIKNLFIFLPLFFSMKIMDIDLLVNTCLAFISFSLIASAVYIMNDYFDIESDKLHPSKCTRPLVSGSVSKSEAIITTLLLLVLGSMMMYYLSMKAFFILLVYVLINILYSLYLKHIAILDVVTIAIGFVLRIFVGTSVTMLNASKWIVVMTFLLALFLALAKRRDDVLLFNKTGQKMRKVIDGYNLNFVDKAMTLMAGIVIVSYLMYCVSPEVILRTGSDKLYLTLIYVIIGIMRYMQITFVEESSESPTKILIQDKMMQVIIILWIITFGIILY